MIKPPLNADGDVPTAVLRARQLIRDGDVPAAALPGIGRSARWVGNRRPGIATNPTATHAHDRSHPCLNP